MNITNAKHWFTQRSRAKKAVGAFLVVLTLLAIAQVSGCDVRSLPDWLSDWAAKPPSWVTESDVLRQVSGSKVPYMSPSPGGEVKVFTIRRDNVKSLKMRKRDSENIAVQIECEFEGVRYQVEGTIPMMGGLNRADNHERYLGPFEGIATLSR